MLAIFPKRIPCSGRRGRC